MTRIEFHILASDAVDQRLHYVRQLVLRSLIHGKTVHIHTGSAADTRLLMTTVIDATAESSENLSIDHKGEPPETERQVLINLAAEVPYFFSSFDVTHEVIPESGQLRSMGRERYRYYQQRGYPLKHTNIQPELALG